MPNLTEEIDKALAVHMAACLAAEASYKAAVYNARLARIAAEEASMVVYNAAVEAARKNALTE